MKRKKIIISVCIIIGLLGFSIYSNEKKKEESNLPAVDSNYVDFFKNNCIYKEIITYAQEDINNDNKKDLVVVYKNDKEINETVAIVSSGDNMYITESTIAPKENINITFRNIDEKDEIEVMISGSKKGNVGYAIYRLQDKKLIDLFGEGMEACC